ncbi:Hypothetical predicted protein [Octopus vulgaris]|uniref:Uncharacterized protein n=1 Tax=Octopus vulgaris TaxID=6645 RepID=A0AA36BEJ6_OCTVU|nr:Hypothetical predicted protein [Octopus vulgaris]
MRRPTRNYIQIIHFFENGEVDVYFSSFKHGSSAQSLIKLSSESVKPRCEIYSTLGNESESSEPGLHIYILNIC